MRPFEPPISADMSAATLRPVSRSRCSRSLTALIAVLDLLDVHGGRADHPARHDQLVVGQLVEVDQGDRAVVLGGLQRLEQADPGVTAAAGAQDRAAPRECPQRRRIE